MILRKIIFRTKWSPSPKLTVKPLEFHLKNGFSEQKSSKIFNNSNNYRDYNQASDNFNGKKNIEFINFQAFIEKMKVLFFL